MVPEWLRLESHIARRTSAQLHVREASVELALEIPPSCTVRFALALVARVLPRLETKHAYGRRARNAGCLRRDFIAVHVGPLRVAGRSVLKLTHDYLT